MKNFRILNCLQMSPGVMKGKRYALFIWKHQQKKEIWISLKSCLTIGRRRCYAQGYLFRTGMCRIKRIRTRVLVRRCSIVWKLPVPDHLLFLALSYNVVIKNRSSGDLEILRWLWIDIAHMIANFPEDVFGGIKLTPPPLEKPAIYRFNVRSKPCLSVKHIIATESVLLTRPVKYAKLTQPLLCRPLE